MNPFVQLAVLVELKHMEKNVARKVATKRFLVTLGWLYETHRPQVAELGFGDEQDRVVKALGLEREAQAHKPACRPSTNTADES